MVMYPLEWDEYMIPYKVRTFKKETPPEIVKAAEKLNKRIDELGTKDYFKFEKQNGD